MNVLLISSLFLMGVWAEDNSGLFEGDIMLDPVTRAFVQGDNSPENTFKATTGRIWTGGKVYYTFDRNFGSTRKALIMQAIAEYHRKTCVRFIPRRNERNYIHMTNTGGCWSMIGMTGGKQLLKLGSWCAQLGTAKHELMHAIGFFHEQSRADRDQHVKIFWDNIQSGESYNFNKYRTNYLGEPYDLNSIMHYRNTEFGKWGQTKTTIQSIKWPNMKLGNADFTVGDIRQINKLYNCDSVQPPSTQQPPTACGNNHQRCQEWADRSPSECTKNPHYMHRECRKACKLC